MNMEDARKSALAYWLGDDAGKPVYQEAFLAVAEARADGRNQGTHSPDSWRQEDLQDRLERAQQHVYNAYCNIAEEGKSRPDRQEMTHAICDIAIVMAILTERDKVAARLEATEDEAK